MREINFSAEKLVGTLLDLKKERNLCLLDSCGMSHLDSHLLIAGINPLEVFEIREDSAETSLAMLDQKLFSRNTAAILTISYDFGLKLNKIRPNPHKILLTEEPDIFLAIFDVLIVHDYKQNKTFLKGNAEKFDEIEKILHAAAPLESEDFPTAPAVSSNFSPREYFENVEKIKELIRDGETYQTNLTQQLSVKLSPSVTAEQAFLRLREKHPAPFAAFLRRKQDTVISASPERFFKIENSNVISKEDSPENFRKAKIIVSPIKGTRPRGKNAEEDLILKNELLESAKDHAENVMIVDLLRNDIGRICEFGSVKVEKLCDLEEHPSLFHLVSTISGELRSKIRFSDMIRAVFPCGSITGAPKIRTMQIIEEIENAARGLSMGAVGFVDFDGNMDFSVAIRTMNLSENRAVFNVGGGITIESDAREEYAETLTKATALLDALNADF